MSIEVPREYLVGAYVVVLVIQTKSVAIVAAKPRVHRLHTKHLVLVQTIPRAFRTVCHDKLGRCQRTGEQKAGKT